MTFLAENGFSRSDIKSWVMHTGGPKVLEATATALGITAKDLEASWNCLRKVGNISSTSVLLVLEDVYSHRRPDPGTLSILAAMGPGFCCGIGPFAMVDGGGASGSCEPTLWLWERARLGLPQQLQPV